MIVQQLTAENKAALPRLTENTTTLISFHTLEVSLSLNCLRLKLIYQMESFSELGKLIPAKSLYSLPQGTNSWLREAAAHTIDHGCRSLSEPRCPGRLELSIAASLPSPPSRSQDGQPTVAAAGQPTKPATTATGGTSARTSGRRQRRSGPPDGPAAGTTRRRRGGGDLGDDDRDRCSSG